MAHIYLDFRVIFHVKQYHMFHICGFCVILKNLIVKMLHN